MHSRVYTSTAFTYFVDECVRLEQLFMNKFESAHHNKPYTAQITLHFLCWFLRKKVHDFLKFPTFGPLQDLF